jgi:hypothetical protein
MSSEIARAVFENNPEAIYQGMLRRLKKGDARAFKVLAERAYGRVKEQIEFEASEALVERLEAGRRRLLEGMSDDELTERIRQLEQELGYVPTNDHLKKSDGLLPEVGHPVMKSVACESDENSDSTVGTARPSLP